MLWCKDGRYRCYQWLYYYTSYSTLIISVIMILKRFCKTISHLRNLHKFISQRDAVNER